MADLNTANCPYKHLPTGEPITDPTLIKAWTPLSATVTDRPDPPPGPPIGSCANEFTSQFDCLKEQQASRKLATYKENERKREILHQRDLEHCRKVNHERMMAESNELRELITAAYHISAQKTNVQQMEAKERQRLNERLAELKSGAECRCSDAVHLSELDDHEREVRRKQNDLKESYEKALREKEQKMFEEHLAFEEERKHIDKMAQEEQQRWLDAAKRRTLEKERWQQMIRDFQDQRKAAKAQAAEDLWKENEKIAFYNTVTVAKDARDGQKALRAERERVTEELRNRLIVEMKAKEDAILERSRISEELLSAEDDEKEKERLRQLKANKLTKRNEMREAVRESRASQQIRDEKKKRDWAEYQEVLKQQAQAADYFAEQETKLRHDRQTAVVRFLDQQRADHRSRTIQEKAREAEWAAKEDQDSRLWREFVDAEREKSLRTQDPELTAYVKGYHRFSYKKDDHLFEETLQKTEDGSLKNARLIHENKQPLAKQTPQPGSSHEVYRNLQEARLAETFGIGSR